MEEFTEVENISYGQNIKNAIGSAILGIILFLASFLYYG